MNKDLLKWLWPFFVSLFIINFIGLVLLAYLGKDELHLYFNRNYHTELFDFFFKYYTDLVSKVLLFGTLIYIVLQKTFREFIFLLWTLLTAGIFAEFIKRLLFVDGHRPTFYFEQKGIDLHLINGVHSQIPYSFPSGHTVAAVVLGFYFCMKVKNRGLQFLICFLMALVPVGRVYLSKHFVIDTIGGSMIALFFCIFGYYFIWTSGKDFLNQKVMVSINRKK